jgi:hypothetical protein
LDYGGGGGFPLACLLLVRLYLYTSPLRESIQRGKRIFETLKPCNFEANFAIKLTNLQYNVVTLINMPGQTSVLKKLSSFVLKNVQSEIEYLLLATLIGIAFIANVWLNA